MNIFFFQSFRISLIFHWPVGNIGVSKEGFPGNLHALVSYLGETCRKLGFPYGFRDSLASKHEASLQFPHQRIPETEVQWLHILAKLIGKFGVSMWLSLMFSLESLRFPSGFNARESLKPGRRMFSFGGNHMESKSFQCGNHVESWW